MKINFLLVLLITTSILVAQSLPFHKIHTRSTASFNEATTRAVAFDKNNSYVYIVNQKLTRLDVFDYSNARVPQFQFSIDLSPYFSEIVDVDVYLKQIAVIGYTNPQSSGKLMFFDEKGISLGQFPVGATPRDVEFSPNGTWVMTTGAGVPADDYSFDPIGYITLIAINNGIPNLPSTANQFIDFTGLDTTSYDPAIHVFGNNGNQLPSEDLEPESVTFNPSSTKAYVTLQENNAVAIVDVLSGTLDTVVGLGYKDFSTIGLDASDTRPDINIKSYPHLYGLYQPDGIASYNANSQTYFVTANEGAPRNYSGYSEVVHTTDFVFNAADFPNISTIYHDSTLGRLELTDRLGNFDNDVFQDSLFCFGARSFSIWDESGQQIWDSGDEFESKIAQLFPNNFNSAKDDNNSYKSQSNQRGPQPETVVIGEVDGTPYAFIGLSQMGGFMIYDLTDPANPQFVLYELNREFSKPANDASSGDLGLSSMEFVPAIVSPTGYALLLVANEVSGSVSTYEMGIGIGLEETYKLNGEGIYPNPSHGIFNTTYRGNYNVYNLDGKLIKSMEDETQIDLSNQPDGIYIIKNEDGQAIRAIKK